MNKNVVRALFDDALYQVLDNMVFRILAVIVVVFVVPTFLVGFREDDVVALFTWHSDYPEWLKPIASYFGDTKQHGTIAWVQSAFVDSVAGSVGMLFCIVATSFFMPRMMEKGAADTVFSKPVSRMAWLLSRYAAGLLFVGLLSTLLIGGQFAGFTLVSGYSDPGFLWSVFTLMWLFMMLHAVSLFAAVYSRSSIAAVMFVILFFVSTGGIHGGWRLKEQWREEHEAKMEKAREKHLDTSELEPGTTANVLITALDVAHYVLPKTSDATLIAKLFRRQFEGRRFELLDDDTHIRLTRAPEGYTREPRSSLNQEGLLWIAPHPTGGGEATWKLSRKAASESGSRSSVVKALKKELGDNPTVASERGDIDRYNFDRVEWHEQRGTETRLRRRWILQSGDWMVTLDYDAELAWAQQEREQQSADKFFAGFSIQDHDGGPNGMQIGPHERDFGWSAPWRHNAWFSIATTAGFIAAILGLTWLKLSRTDF